MAGTGDGTPVGPCVRDWEVQEHRPLRIHCVNIHEKIVSSRGALTSTENTTFEPAPYIAYLSI